ncbi:MAG: hypothetical protein JKY60_20520, partial [Kordiimonadaceae bacterium]|nr:hypothetical protein [Kordiimonadaceae bacterium]
RENETEYTSRAIRMLKKFAKNYGVLVIVVAHPSKMNFNGDTKRPQPYDINGSANWYNKSDYCVVVWRPDIAGTKAEIHISKVKNHDYMGKPGVVDLDFNVNTGRFDQYVSDREFRKT